MEKMDWVVILKKPDAELFPILVKVLNDHTLIFALIIKNVVAVASDSIRSQLITVLQQNLAKIIAAYVQVATTAMGISSGREAVSANFVKVFTAFKQVWTNAIQTLKSYKGGSPADSLTGIDTNVDTNTILNGFIAFLKSEKANSASVEILCKGFSVPKNFEESVALWPQVVRALLVELKNQELNSSELIFQSARAVLFYRKVLLEPNSVSVKDWEKSKTLLNKFSQELVNLLVARFSDQDITQKLTAFAATVKEIQQALR